MESLNFSSTRKLGVGVGAQAVGVVTAVGEVGPPVGQPGPPTSSVVARWSGASASRSSSSRIEHRRWPGRPRRPARRRSAACAAVGGRRCGSTVAAQVASGALGPGPVLEVVGVLLAGRAAEDPEPEQDQGERRRPTGERTARSSLGPGTVRRRRIERGASQAAASPHGQAGSNRRRSLGLDPPAPAARTMAPVTDATCSPTSRPAASCRRAPTATRWRARLAEGPITALLRLRSRPPTACTSAT